jgi:hypothetical protein
MFCAKELLHSIMDILIKRTRCFVRQLWQFRKLCGENAWLMDARQWEVPWGHC